MVGQSHWRPGTRWFGRKRIIGSSDYHGTAIDCSNGSAEKTVCLNLYDRAEKVAVFPPSMRTYIAAQIETAEELSVSRPESRVKWGVPVPCDPEQTIYVWVDALINYITVLGYPESLNGWPVDVHVVGKDIIRCVGLEWSEFQLNPSGSTPSTGQLFSWQPVSSLLLASSHTLTGR